MDTVLFGNLTVGTLLAFAGGGIGVSIIAQLLKRLLGLSSSKVIHFVVITLSFVASALDYVISAIHGNPAILASHTASILGIANAAHTFIVSDADAFVGKVKTALGDEQAKDVPAEEPPRPASQATETSETPAAPDF